MGHQRQRGYTLIELVIVTLLLGLFVGIAMTMLSSGFEAYYHGQELTESSVHGRLALARFTRDVRDIAPGAIQTATASQFTFTGSDGVSVTYDRLVNDLRRTQGVSSPSRLAQHLSNDGSGLLFNYFQADGVTTAVATSDIRYIQMSINFDYDPSQHINYVEPYMTEVGLRN